MTKRQGSEPNSACGKRCVHTVGPVNPGRFTAQELLFRGSLWKSAATLLEYVDVSRREYQDE